MQLASNATESLTYEFNEPPGETSFWIGKRANEITKETVDTHMFSTRQYWLYNTSCDVPRRDHLGTSVLPQEWGTTSSLHIYENQYVG